MTPRRMMLQTGAICSVALTMMASIALGVYAITTANAAYAFLIGPTTRFGAFGLLFMAFHDERKT